MERVKLTDICNPKQWKTIPTSDLLEEGFPVYGANGIIGFFSEYNHENPVVTITCRGATCGSINITVPKAYVTGNAMCLDDVRQDIDISYLYFCLLHFDFSKVISGSAQPQITRHGLEKVSLSIGTPAEQKSIVSILKSVETIIKKREKELAYLDDLIKARFVEMFGDILTDQTLPLIELKRLADIGSSKRIFANEYETSGVPFYRSKEIRELGSGLKPSTELFIKQERYEEIKQRFGVPKEGDILIAAIGATIGYSWIVDTKSPFYYKDGNLILLSLKDGVNPVFLNHTMGILIKDFKNKGVAGSAQLALTIEKLEKMKVVNPDLELQNQFADFVKQVDKSKVAVQKALDEAQLLFDSLMQKYFG